jgi:hypothetical protein
MIRALLKKIWPNGSRIYFLVRGFASIRRTLGMLMLSSGARTTPAPGVASQL